jgi:hypothetical protein
VVVPGKFRAHRPESRQPRPQSRCNSPTFPHRTPCNASRVHRLPNLAARCSVGISDSTKAKANDKRAVMGALPSRSLIWVARPAYSRTGTLHQSLSEPFCSVRQGYHSYGYEARPSPVGIPHPRHPAARITRAFQVEATNLENPESVDCSGFIFVTLHAGTYSPHLRLAQ